MPQSVRVAIEDRIARIGIDDGKVNALSCDLIAEIDTALAAAEEAHVRPGGSRCASGGDCPLRLVDGFLSLLERSIAGTWRCEMAG